MSNSNQEAQENELIALSAIYDDSEFSESREDNVLGGEFRASLNLPEEFEILFGSEQNPKSREEDLSVRHHVQYLPPVTLFFQLPEDYPSCSAPSFSLACEWLSLHQISKLCRKLDGLWRENEGQEVLFLWTNFLKDESFDFLELSSALDLSNICSVKQKTTPHLEDSENGSSNPSTLTFDPRAIQNLAKQDLLMPTVLEYDKKCRHEAFMKAMITCCVCFMDRLGSQCIQFYECEHTFCKDCMRSYFEVQINDGNVKALTCPSEKCDSQAHPSQVKELVSDELFSRYDRLLLQSGLDTMSDIMYCPRKDCNYPVMVDQSCGMGSCPDCHYVFCILCKLAYHGVSPCRLQAGELEKLRNQYLSGSSEEKKQLESRYGKRVIHQYIEESFSRAWLENESKQCPSCKARIQKIDGCNKMTCFKCRAHFCWLCGVVLNHSNPYLHFNTPTSPCNNRLFQGVIMDEDRWLEEELDEDFLVL